MDLQKFIKEQHKQLDAFEAYWEKQHRKNPEQFPVNLAPGEWDEQYQAWCVVTNPKEAPK